MVKYSLKEYQGYYNELKEITKKILNLKNQEYKSETANILEINEEKELLYELLFFVNFKEWIIINTDFNIMNNDKDSFFEKLQKIKIYRNKDIFNNNMIKRIYHMHLYAILKLEKTIKFLVLNEKDKDECIEEINQLYHIIFHIFLFITKLFFENVYNLQQLLLFLDCFVFFIERKSSINDKYLKIKNKILFELLFDFYGKISTILLKGNQSKENILYFFNYLKKNLGNNNLLSYLNTSTLTYNKIIHKFMSLILNNFNFSELSHEEIYKQCKNWLIGNFANIFGKNINQSYFLEILINQNKKSFVNLYNFTENKENIIKDIYLNNFYIELLNKLFEKEKVEYSPPKNYFIYNGYNSKLTIELNKLDTRILSPFILEKNLIQDFKEWEESTHKLDKIDLDKSILFFSFQLDNDIDNK